MRLVLASASPRRQEILYAAGVPFVVRPANVDETPIAGESPEAFVQRLAEAKAQDVRRNHEHVLGADTVVVIDEAVLGKPADIEDAQRMLRSLSGRTHRVLTGICLLHGDQVQQAVEETTVYFRELDEQEIADYVATGEPMDKAGAYGIQGAAAKFIHRVEGCYFNVVGLPISRVYNFIRSSLR